MLMPDMRDHGQLYGHGIKSPARRRPADAPAASQTRVCCNLACFRRRTARELLRNSLCEGFHKILVFDLALYSGTLPSALAFRRVGGAFLFCLLQSGCGDEKSLTLIPLAGAAKAHHDC